MGYFSSFVKGHSSIETIGSPTEHPDDDRRSKRMSIRLTKHTPRSSVVNEPSSRSSIIIHSNDPTFRRPGNPLSPARQASDRTAVDSHSLSADQSRKGLMSKMRFGFDSKLAPAPFQTMPSIPQRKVCSSIYQPSELTREAVDQEAGVDIMASRLNQLATANFNGLLGDEDYRLLRQMVFVECTNSQNTPLGDRSSRTIEPAGLPDASIRGLSLDWKPTLASYHERTSSLGPRHARCGSRQSSSSARYTSMSVPKVFSAEGESSEEILSTIRSIVSESGRVMEMFNHMEQEVLNEAVENGWTVDQNGKDRTEVKLRDIRERKQDVQNRYDLRLDLFRKKLRAAEIKANVMR